MSRMVWLAVGAAGGIVAYKKATRILDDARQRTLVGNVNAAATTASAVVSNVRGLVSAASQPQRANATEEPVGRLDQWNPPRSDAASSISSPNGDTQSYPVPH
jgi:hypothetical protein